MNEQKSNELFEYFVEKSMNNQNQVLIGSRQWGGSVSHSDYDIAVNETRWKEIEKLLQENGFDIILKIGISNNDHHTMFNIENVKIDLGTFTRTLNQKINFIVWKDEDFDKIIELNKIVELINKTPVGDVMKKDKQRRIEVIESFLNALFVEKIYQEEKEQDVECFPAF